MAVTKSGGSSTTTVNTTRNFLTSLYEASSDAQSNLFEIEFEGLASITAENSEVKQKLSARCNNFKAPTTRHSTYDVNFMNVSIPRPASKVEVTREFTFDMRVDSNYTVYKYMLAQQKLVFNAAKSRAAYDIPSLDSGLLFTLFTTKVNVLTNSSMTLPTDTDSSKGFETIYTFEKCWISSIEPLTFTRDSSEAQTVRVTVSFIYMKDFAEN